MNRSLGAVRYPIAGPAGERPLLAIWIAFSLAVVVPLVPLFLVVGYLVRALVANERGESLPPFLADGWRLLRQSAGGAALCALFLGPPLLALVVTIYGVIFSSSGGDVPTVRILAGSTAVLLVGLLALYLLPIALTTYGRTGSLRSALSLSSLRAAGSHGAYFVGWTLGCVGLCFAAALGRVLFAVPRIGPVLGTLPLAYGLLVAGHVWGRAVGRTR
jgi:hypothetical protein